LLVKELTQKKEKVAENKIDVILNGIDTAPFLNNKPDLDLKRKLNIPESSKVVGIIANFRPMKHHYAFVKASAEILKTRSDVEFILVGGEGGQLRNKIEMLAQSLSISDKMHFVGVQKNVIPYLSIMNVGVNCSEGEGLSNAIMEYMVSGVPAVVSNGGGNPDLITHDVNGYVFKVDDHKSLASYTLQLLADSVTCERFTANAFKKIVKEMSLDAMLSKYENYYARLANV